MNAAERELDELRKLPRDRDEEIKKIIAVSDQARTSIQEAESRQQELEAQLEGSLEGVNRVLLENHVETCVMHAVEEGRTTEIVDELLETIRYTPAITGPIKEATQ